jgi:hypothetical protein
MTDGHMFDRASSAAGQSFSTPKGAPGRAILEKRNPYTISIFSLAKHVHADLKLTWILLACPAASVISLLSQPVILQCTKNRLGKKVLDPVQLCGAE